MQPSDGIAGDIGHKGYQGERKHKHRPHNTYLRLQPSSHRFAVAAAGRHKTTLEERAKRKRKEHRTPHNAKDCHKEPLEQIGAIYIHKAQHSTHKQGYQQHRRPTEAAVH